jgi:tyrosyl-tRNA synthetase
MFGKAMSISDELMARWYPILLGRALDPELHPMEAKKGLAGALVERFHDEEAARAARVDFETKFSKKDLQAVELPEVTVSESPIWIIKLLQETGAAKSGGEARRLVAQGAVRYQDEKVTDDKAQITVVAGGLLQSGKRFFVRLHPPG